MRRNLVGKKLPQELTLIGTKSVTEDLTGASVATIESNHSATVGGWVPVGTTETRLRDEQYWTDVTPAFPIQQGDLIAVSYTDVLHGTGNETTFTSGTDLKRHWTKVSSDTTTTAYSTPGDYTLAGGSHATDIGQCRLEISDVVGDVTIEFARSSGGSESGALSSFQYGSTDLYYVEYEGTGPFTVTTTLTLASGASCTVKAVHYDDDDLTLGGFDNSQQLVYGRPNVLFVNNDTGEMHVPTAIAGEESRPLNLRNTSENTWGNLQSYGANACGGGWIYSADDGGIPGIHLKVYVSTDITYITSGASGYPINTWSDDVLGFVREFELRRVACGAIIRPGNTYDNDLALQSSFSNGVNTRVRNTDDNLVPTLTEYKGLQANDFTADSIGIYMGQCAFFAHSELEDYLYALSDADYYGDGYSRLRTSNILPSSAADVFVAAGGSQGAGPVPNGYQKGLWRQEAWISLENMDINSADDAEFNLSAHWQAVAGSWGFYA